MMQRTISKTAIRHIRPHIVFDSVPKERRCIRLLLPNGLIGYPIFEATILLALEQIVLPKKIFEFGTYLGGMTLLLAMNSPEDVRIVTLDLGVDNIESACLSQYERALAEKAAINEPCFVGLSEATRITRIFGDSHTMDLADHFNSYQFVYIDGGHIAGVVKADTENAFKMLSKGEAGVIAWHDYGNQQDAPDVKPFLDDLSNSVPIYLVGDTRIAFHPIGLSLEDVY